MPIRGEALQRIRYGDEQLLRAGDLNGDDSYKAAMRRLHVRGLHGTWGVALGFPLSLSADRRQVVIGPGLAYDALGRELLLPEALALGAPLPPAGSGVQVACDLALSLREPAKGRCRRTTDCGDRSPRGGVSVRWVVQDDGSPSGFRARDLRLGIEVPLGRFTLDPPSMTLDGPEPGFRQCVRPMRRPRIAAGTVRLADTVRPGTLDVVTEVSTGDARFRATPQYFVFPAQPAAVFGEAGVAGPLLAVSRATRSQLLVHATFVPTGVMITAERIRRIEALLQKGFPVRWVGVEPCEGCGPA
jgi:hypothetical protein